MIYSLVFFPVDVAVVTTDGVGLLPLELYQIDCCQGSYPPDVYPWKFGCLVLSTEPLVEVNVIMGIFIREVWTR